MVSSPAIAEQPAREQNLITLLKAERILRKRGFLDDPAIIEPLQSPPD